MRGKAVTFGLEGRKTGRVTFGLPWRGRTLEGPGGSGALLDLRGFAWKGRHFRLGGSRNSGKGVL